MRSVFGLRAARVERCEGEVPRAYRILSPLFTQRQKLRRWPRQAWTLGFFTHISARHRVDTLRKGGPPSQDTRPGLSEGTAFGGPAGQAASLPAFFHAKPLNASSTGVPARWLV